MTALPALSLEELRAGLASESRTLAALERALATLQETGGPAAIDTEGIWDTVASRRPRQGSDELRAAFHRIYEDNVAAVHAFVRRRAGAEEAEELTAETFSRAYGTFHRWEDRGIPVRAWLLRIAFNQVVGRARKTLPVPLADPDHADARAEDHEEQVDRRLEAGAALRALSSLPASHRTVLELRHLQELSVPETATVMGLSEEATRALTYRAMQGLRKAYAKGAAVPG
ncbi:MAG: sigma-70 family RNA polymerase sigma factor [Acidimicrobiaceae bacterium]|nr:sigma-70 family RNA polymerase sigma factor [Acidimicrobiaceae bacterium]